MHSRSLWLGPAMCSYSPTVPTTELDSLEESSLACLCSRSPLMGGLAFFFVCSGVFFTICVSDVVINARSANSVGASVEELTYTVKTSAETNAVSLA